MKKFLFGVSLVTALLIPISSNGQTAALPPTTQAPVTANAGNNDTSASEQLLQLQQAEVTKLSTAFEQMKQLYQDGIVSRVEYEKSEQAVATARAKVAETKGQITSAQQLAGAFEKAREVEKNRPLVKTTALALSGSGEHPEVHSWILVHWKSSPGTAVLQPDLWTSIADKRCWTKWHS